MAKKIRKLKSGVLVRSLSLAKLGLQVGARAAFGTFGKSPIIGQFSDVALELGKLKGSLMKAGQMLSVYGEHFLPPEANLLLKSLHSQSPSLEWKQIKKVLQKSLGKEKFAMLEVEEEALAAASLGQVHRAKICSTNREIVLKVQYPGVDKAIDSDIRSLRALLRVSKILPQIPNTDTVFAEIKKMMQQELDYEQELRELQFFAKVLKDDARYILPEPIVEFSTNKVLAMGYEPGIPVDGSEVADLSQQRRNALGEAILGLYFQEFYQWRKVQTDPHFGNYRIRIGAKQDSWVLYDFGAVRDLTPEFLKNHTRMVCGILFQDRKAFENAACDMKILQPEDPEPLKELIYELSALFLEPFLRDEIYDWGSTDLPRRVANKGQELLRFRLREPPKELVFLDRKIIGVFTCLAKLKARINGRALLFAISGIVPVKNK